MRSVVMAALLVTAVAPAAANDPTTAELTALTPRVLAAIEKADVAALDAVATWPLHNAYLWFDTPACQKRYSGVQTVAKADAAGLLKCLASLGKPIDGDDGLGIELYEPGFTILLRLDNGKLTGFIAEESDPGAPLIMWPDFAKHVKGGKLAFDPDAATKAAIDKARDVAGVDFRACAEPDGRIAVTVIRTIGTYPSYVTAFTAAAAKWHVTPFVVRGTAVRVCTMANVAYPQRRAAAPPPPPPPRK